MPAEILAPVSGMETARAAVFHGADAVFVGFPGFNARRREADLDFGELARVVAFCHLWGVRVYFAMNVLVRESEMERMEGVLREGLALAPDALIVQDMGLARLVRALCPAMPLHASTQMTVASAQAARALAEAGFSRVVLARENSIEEIAQIHAAVPQMELEVFTHGALCVSYSGQCLASAMIGGRSANRGECAQCCRLPWTLLKDGQPVDLRKRSYLTYLLSLKDLSAVEHLDALERAGVASFKIEGRLKSPEYVAAACLAHARRKMNAGARVFFSRGQGRGWLFGRDANAEIFTGRTAGAVGEFLGAVERAHGKAIWVRTDTELHAGDGLLFLGHGGASVFLAARDGKLLKIDLLSSFSGELPPVGCAVYRNASPRLEKEIMAQEELPVIDLKVKLYGRPGEPLSFSALGRAVSLESPLEVAERPAGLAAIEAECKKWHGTPFVCAECEMDIEGAFVNAKMVRKLRQAWLAAGEPVPPVMRPVDWNALAGEFPIAPAFPEGQLEALPATLQVFRQGEEALVRELAESRPEAILVQSLGALAVLRGMDLGGTRLVAGPAFGASNALTVAWLLSLGCSAVVPALDLPPAELARLKSRCGGALWLARTSRVPAFHMEFCPVTAYGGNGKRFPACGSPCKRHRWQLQDHKGAVFEISSDAACRTTVWMGTFLNSLP
jgi:putative protease